MADFTAPISVLRQAQSETPSTVADPQGPHVEGVMAQPGDGEPSQDPGHMEEQGSRHNVWTLRALYFCL